MVDRWEKGGNLAGDWRLVIVTGLIGCCFSVRALQQAAQIEDGLGASVRIVLSVVGEVGLRGDGYARIACIDLQHKAIWLAQIAIRARLPDPTVENGWSERELYSRFFRT